MISAGRKIDKNKLCISIPVSSEHINMYLSVKMRIARLQLYGTICLEKHDFSLRVIGCIM